STVWWGSGGRNEGAGSRSRWYEPPHCRLGIEGISDVYDAVLWFLPLLYVAVASSLFVRLRRAIGVERQQIKWFAYAVAATISGIILAYMIPESINTPLWFERAGFALNIAVTPAIPISMGIAILRYRLYDIDILINRTLVYGSLTAMLVLVYFGGVTLLQGVLRGLTGQESTLAVVASTLLIAALFNPLRRRIQGFIDRRFYRSTYDARKTLETFSVKLRGETDLEALGDDLVGVVQDTMQPAHVSVWLRRVSALKQTQGSE
ncbi:MAG: putative two-component system sensor kinase, partial [Rubrobacteraceae bacterium]|nr:putative two-component system sensor kinase [Rubrobacteraceae bacterium]